jgi:hypothetical protein
MTMTLNSPIEELELTTRSYNGLASVGIKTIGQLINHNEYDLLKIPNIGRLSINEISKRVEKFGFKLRSLHAHRQRPMCNFNLNLQRIVETSGYLIDQCHGLARHRGWWHDLDTGMEANRNIGEMLCLIHSEISEAMEGHRKGLMDDKLPRRPMLEVELADAVIRIFDMAGGLKLDLAGAIADKLHYNSTREDHNPENRLADGGKKF